MDQNKRREAKIELADILANAITRWARSIKGASQIGANSFVRIGTHYDTLVIDNLDKEIGGPIKIMIS